MEHSPDTINQQQPQDTKARPQLHTQRSQHQKQSSQKRERKKKTRKTTTKTVNSKHISLSTQLQSATSDITFNPFVVPGCKMSVLKNARTRLQNSIFSGPAANGLSMLCVLMQIVLYASAKNKTRGFESSHFYWSFLCCIMTVKGVYAPPNCTDGRAPASASSVFWLGRRELAFLVVNIRGRKVRRAVSATWRCVVLPVPLVVCYQTP